jgi:hypothetical protein
MHTFSNYGWCRIPWEGTSCWNFHISCSPFVVNLIANNLSYLDDSVKMIVRASVMVGAIIHRINCINRPVSLLKRRLFLLLGLEMTTVRLMSAPHALPRIHVHEFSHPHWTEEVEFKRTLVVYIVIYLYSYIRSNFMKKGLFSSSLSVQITNNEELASLCIIVSSYNIVLDHLQFCSVILLWYFMLVLTGNINLYQIYSWIYIWICVGFTLNFGSESLNHMAANCFYALLIKYHGLKKYLNFVHIFDLA